MPEKPASIDTPASADRWSNTTILLLVPVLFLTGVLLGKLDWQAVKRNFDEAYMNHYLTRSGANIERYIYYVQSDNEVALRELQLLRPGILEVESTRYSRLFNVHLTAAARQPLISKLRELDGVSAVFTIPFMCH